ncbi:MAG: TetR family transcriptional regulator [Conexibacter sp.]
MARPTSPLLNRDRIVETALAIIDGEGLPALSTRRLARELGVSGPSLYYHFATKEDILDAVSEHIAAQTVLTHQDTWQDVLRDFARSYRKVMTAHPNAVEFMALRPVHHRAALASYEWQLRALAVHGWDVGSAWETVMGIELLVLGTALQSGAPELVLTDPELREDYPLLAEAGDLHLVRPDTVFERATESFIAGLRPPPSR